MWKLCPHLPETAAMVNQIARKEKYQESRLTQCAAIPRILASWTAAIKMNLADTADIVFRYIPVPCCNGLP